MYELPFGKIKKPNLREKAMFVLARAFGKKIECTDEPPNGDLKCTLTGYEYKGRLYVVDIAYGV